MTYKTAQIAKLAGVHPNTIRFYEEMKLLPPVPRTPKGYRIFSDRHLEQLDFLRVAFRAEIISDQLRREVYDIVKIFATDHFSSALDRTQLYLAHLSEEKSRANEAIQICKGMMDPPSFIEQVHNRVTAAESLGITIDVLRDWERNGLISVPRNPRGHRIYREKEMNRLKMIRTLRCAHYSMMAILRMLTRLDQGNFDIEENLNTPSGEEDIIGATDCYISALQSAEADAQLMIEKLEKYKSLQYTTT